MNQLLMSPQSRNWKIGPCLSHCSQLCALQTPCTCILGCLIHFEECVRWRVLSDATGTLPEPDLVTVINHSFWKAVCAAAHFHFLSLKHLKIFQND